MKSLLCAAVIALIAGCGASGTVSGISATDHMQVSGENMLD